MVADLARYISKTLIDKKPFYQWKVRIDEQKYLVELLFTIREDVEDDIQVQDIMGQNNKSGYIQFEDIICFYDPNVSHVQPANYLTAIPLDINVGLEKGMVDAVLKQLEIVLSSGRRDFHEFLKDPNVDAFSFEWDEENFARSISTLKDTNRFDEEKVMMVIEEEVSIIDQFTGGSDYDGVERV